jgi:phage repressor protein C with HTH and peptisase S24 domain
MDAVRKLILDRAADTGTNLAELSRKIGKNHAYLQQFVKRGIPAELPEKVRHSLAPALGVSESSLRHDNQNGTVNHRPLPVERRIVDSLTQDKLASDARKEADFKPGAELFGEADLPVFGTAQGGRGALIVTDRAVDWVVRPAPLLRVRDGYGMIVSGDSMDPAMRAGWTALVNPHLPPRPGDICIFRSHSDDGEVHVCIKELVRFTDELWHVRQYNPRKSYTLKRSEWQVCHVTVGNYSGR